MYKVYMKTAICKKIRMPISNARVTEIEREQERERTSNNYSATEKFTFREISFLILLFGMLCKHLFCGLSILMHYKYADSSIYLIK